MLFRSSKLDVLGTLGFAELLSGLEAILLLLLNSSQFGAVEKPGHCWLSRPCFFFQARENFTPLRREPAPFFLRSLEKMATQRCTFTEEDSVWKDLDGGEQCALHLADINGDSAMDAFFGNSRGGIMLYTEKGQPIVSVEEVPTTILQVQLFPNPASDRVIVELSAGAIKQLELLDLTGRILMAYQGLGENRFQLDLQGMSPGIYLVNVRSTEGLARTMRVLKTE